jgi:hypothetical protein
MRRAFDAMKLASALREMLWAMVSQLRLSAPGVDYSAYALACQAKFTQSLQRYKERRGPIA